MTDLRESFTVSHDRYLRILDDPTIRLLVKLQDQLTRVTTNFWHRRGAMNMHLPITTNSISSPMGLGSDSSPVDIDLFGQRTYLADSMQFMLEYGCRLSPDGTWYLMPSFRGEEADATHLNQFFHSEAEIRGGLSDVIAVVTDYVRALADAALGSFEAELIAVAGTSDHLRAMAESESFPQLTLDEAVDYLQGDDEAIRHDPAGFRVLTRHGERRLITEINPFVWVTHFDHLSVPFYQAYEPGTDQAKNADLLFGIGEVVGAGERHIDGAQTRAALAQHHVPEEDYGWYVRLKDERPLLTSGFGLGVERWMMWALQQPDIRELQLLPRLNGLAIVP